MSQITAQSGRGGHGHGHGHGHAEPAHVAARRRLNMDEVTLGPGAGVLTSNVLLIAGIAAIVVAIIAGVSTGQMKLAMASYLVGGAFALAICLGGWAFTMIMHQFNAGWSATIRRGFENLMSLVPIAAILVAAVGLLDVFMGGVLYKWMNPAYVAGDTLYDIKRPFLNTPFFVVRCIFYVVVWWAITSKLYGWSREQDSTGEVMLTAKARRLSAGGLLVFALTVAFASFDWFMTLDFHWFSTMWPVFIFAHAMLSCTAATIMIYGILKARGKMGKAATPEHFHDLGKLLLAFTCFWAYISFSQFFLYWYANIPEVNAFYVVRLQNGWEYLFYTVAIGQFLAPFPILLLRPVKRRVELLVFMSGWVLVMQVLSMFLTLRPVVFKDQIGIAYIWLDLVAIVGPILVIAGLAVRKFASAPLVPIKDPRLQEALNHKNYV